MDDHFRIYTTSHTGTHNGVNSETNRLVVPPESNLGTMPQAQTCQSETSNVETYILGIGQMSVCMMTMPQSRFVRFCSRLEDKALLCASKASAFIENNLKSKSMPTRLIGAAALGMMTSAAAPLTHHLFQGLLIATTNMFLTYRLLVKKMPNEWPAMVGANIAGSLAFNILGHS
jgi:hypothetical protein